jgi:ABC-type antimicrobial peptide transport system permease subunit
VLDYWVNVRQKEIAIRMALGAQQSAILRWAAAHAMRLSIFGIALGILGSWTASRWLKSLVFGVSANSPGMLIATAVVVIGIALAAAAVPLWRTIRVDAVRNLHDA